MACGWEAEEKTVFNSTKFLPPPPCHCVPCNSSQYSPCTPSSISPGWKRPFADTTFTCINLIKKEKPFVLNSEIWKWRKEYFPLAIKGVRKRVILQRACILTSVRIRKTVSEWSHRERKQPWRRKASHQRSRKETNISTWRSTGRQNFVLLKL